ncbi:hypothetical protein M5X00_31660 [Paenibacillus alvei]|uniref:Restriction endonuclease n=1 Tax=Paenibacillus alvei TaxID=44250 RepID=A0ABT4H5K0_PAEAL|nr:hypothetical protein [Paenibacillus alvei]EJW14140.1 hypothetical protein PAV_19c00060 [Paenibacillus alvei DSM 29]MCY7485716.1 hypothetical protein [Paenibacillus alvei]MCY9544135.1 hypothetical protein [Paenibacillus alvei]MCY9708145.1 hypothetical protein [Paenibacillus alvei]MCY9758777.1 hypothetical protein [Paenibacillus alvei]
MKWASSDMKNYTPPKEFRYVKNDYENISEWMEQHPEANCYYCGKPREEHEMEFSFFDEKFGICKLCFPDFRIGNLATDRFVVKHILSKYKKRSNIIKWFQRNGYELFEAGHNRDPDPKYDWEAYSFVNNPARYFEFKMRTYRGEPLPIGGYLTADEFKEMDLLLRDSTIIEIYKDGEIFIAY